MDYHHIRKIINQWDPIMLIYSSVDIDEYRSEIMAIKDFIDKKKENDVMVVADQIQKIFKKYFDECFRRPYSECLEAAKKILDK